MGRIITSTYFDEQAFNSLLTPPPAPQAEYPFTDGSGTSLADHSGNGFDGTLGGSLGAGYRPAWTSEGLSFSGVKVVGLPAGAVEGMGTAIFGVVPNYTQPVNTQTLLSVSGTDGNQFLGYLGGNPRPCWGIQPVYGDPQQTSGLPVRAGAFVLAFTRDGRIFVDGSEVTFYGNQAHGFPPYWTFNGATVANVGLWYFGAYGAFQGTLSYLTTYAPVLTPGDVAVESARVAAAMRARGITVGADQTMPHTLLCAMGDSMTEGNLADTTTHNYFYDAALQLAGNYHFVNLGVGGDGSPEMADWATNVADRYLPLVGGDKVLIYMIGTNENWSGTLAANAAFYTARKAAGWTKVYAATGLPRFATDTPRQTYNTGLRGGVGVYCDGVFDWGGDPTVGAAGAYTNPTYYPDSLHPSTANHAIGGGLLKTLLNAEGYT